jgi:hypothetical protein
MLNADLIGETHTQRRQGEWAGGATGQQWAALTTRTAQQGVATGQGWAALTARTGHTDSAAGGGVLVGKHGRLTTATWHGQC